MAVLGRLGLSFSVCGFVAFGCSAFEKMIQKVELFLSYARDAFVGDTLGI